MTRIVWGDKEHEVSDLCPCGREGELCKQRGSQVAGGRDSPVSWFRFSGFHCFPPRVVSLWLARGGHWLVYCPRLLSAEPSVSTPALRLHIPAHSSHCWLSESSRMWLVLGAMAPGFAAWVWPDHPMFDGWQSVSNVVMCVSRVSEAGGTVREN